MTIDELKRVGHRLNNRFLDLKKSHEIDDDNLKLKIEIITYDKKPVYSLAIELGLSINTCIYTYTDCISKVLLPEDLTVLKVSELSPTECYAFNIDNILGVFIGDGSQFGVNVIYFDALGRLRERTAIPFYFKYWIAGHDKLLYKSLNDGVLLEKEGVIPVNE